MIRQLARFAAVAVLTMACAARTETTDSAAALAVDTVKPDSAAAAVPESTAADTTSATKAGSGATAKATQTKTATKQGEAKELGRDSIIRFDTKDKRRQLPPADTTKRP